MMPIDDRQSHGHLPSSGQLVGVIVEVFELRCESKYLKSSTAQRWFHGEKIRVRNRNRIIGEVALGLRSALGSTTIGSEGSLRVGVAAWDGVRGTATSLSKLLESSGGPWAVPAIMMRGLIEAHVGGFLPNEVQSMTPTGGHGVGALLRRWQRASPRRTSRDELTAGLVCSRNTVDAWLDRGALPKLESMRAIARFFARRIGQSEGGLLTELRCRCARSRFGRWLRDAVHRRLGRSDGSREAVPQRRESAEVSAPLRSVGLDVPAARHPGVGVDGVEVGRRGHGPSPR